MKSKASRCDLKRRSGEDELVDTIMTKANVKLLKQYVRVNLLAAKKLLAVSVFKSIEDEVDQVWARCSRDFQTWMEDRPTADPEDSAAHLQTLVKEGCVMAIKKFQAVKRNREAHEEVALFEDAVLGVPAEPDFNAGTTHTNPSRGEETRSAAAEVDFFERLVSGDTCSMETPSRTSGRSGYPKRSRAVSRQNVFIGSKVDRVLDFTTIARKLSNDMKELDARSADGVSVPAKRARRQTVGAFRHVVGDRSEYAAASDVDTPPGVTSMDWNASELIPPDSETQAGDFLLEPAPHSKHQHGSERELETSVDDTEKRDTAGSPLFMDDIQLSGDEESGLGVLDLFPEQECDLLEGF
jgi:hypothetical protein